MSIKNLVTYSFTSVLISFVGSLAMILMLSQNAYAAKLTVNISDLEAEKGHLFVALYAGKEDYQKGNELKASKAKVKQDVLSVVFEDIADGDYAIKMYQDENDNNELDKNMMGIPKEGYGFSNNVGMFGQPEYKEAKFVVKDNTVIDIELF